MTERHIPLVLIAAVARNRVIGDGRGLLWHVRGDLRHFRALTMGKPLIMGRRTYESIGKPLPGRETIVVSRDPGFRPAGVRVIHSIEAAIAEANEVAQRCGADAIMVAGGGEIYAQTVALAERLELTEVDLAPEGGVLFPEVDRAVWEEVSRAPQLPAERDEAAYSFVSYVRRRPR